MPVPRERGFLQQLNTIKELVESTCEDKWHLLITLAAPAAGEALLLVLIPSPQEILENYLQPRGRRGTKKRANAGTGQRQKTRWGALRWWQKITFPDVDQIVANNLPGRDVFEGRKTGNAESAFWLGIDVLDRIGWYWLLLDVGRTFISEWSSGIVESRFCTTPLNAIWLAQVSGRPTSVQQALWGGEIQPTVSANKGWDIIGAGEIERENTSIGTSGSFAVEASGIATNVPEGFTHTARLRVDIEHIDQPDTIVLGDPVELHDEQPVTFLLQASATGAVAFRFAIEQVEGFAFPNIEDGSSAISVLCTPDA